MQLRPAVRPIGYTAILLLALSRPLPLLACEWVVGAPDPIQRSVLVARVSAGIVGALALAALIVAVRRARFRGFAAVHLAILAVHPAWTMSPYTGDCGDAMRNAAMIAALVSMAAFAVQLRATRAPELPV